MNHQNSTHSPSAETDRPHLPTVHRVLGKVFTDDKKERGICGKERKLLPQCSQGADMATGSAPAPNTRAVLSPCAHVLLVHMSAHVILAISSLFPRAPPGFWLSGLSL